ncbi:MAG: FmdB family transcriptional regulator [Actinomycetota bacterium]|nr:FmdB family transcriptional regulator [Actinomycetota bacterium]MDQ3575839.1 FmdB family transcriptional regulator [Actinomycetota bacterium]
MPTYEYACRACAEHVEVVQSFKDDPLTVCPNCGGELRKVFGAIGIAFKGSGFYRNDSRSQDPGEKAPKERSEPKGEGAKDGSKSGKSGQAEPAGASSGAGSSANSGTGSSGAGGSARDKARTSQSDRTSAASS